MHELVNGTQQVGQQLLFYIFGYSDISYSFPNYSLLKCQ